MTKTPTAESLSNAMRRLFQLHELSHKQTPTSLSLACSKGCNWCCHTFVGATPAEILFIASTATGRTIDNSREVDYISPKARLGAKIPCSLLVTEGCSIYPIRPIMCRVATSVAVEACIDEYHGRKLSTDIIVSRKHIIHGLNTKTILLTSCYILGLDAATYELSEALGSIRSLADSSAIWAAGAKPFGTLMPVELDRDTRESTEQCISLWTSIS